MGPFGAYGTQEGRVFRSISSPRSHSSLGSDLRQVRTVVDKQVKLLSCKLMDGKSEEGSAAGAGCQHAQPCVEGGGA